ncbi:MAG: hypothetical protein R3A44_37685 [Caldilineaceae bacterium]
MKRATKAPSQLENQIAESDDFDNVAQLTDEPAAQGYGPAVEGR